MSKDKPFGWICPNCGVAYAPWVMSCECEKEFPSDPVRITHWPAMEKLCQDLDEARDQPPLVTALDHDESPCSCQCGASLETDDDHNLRAKLQSLSYDNAALLDQLTRWREVCQQACGGSEELCAAVDDRCVQVHDEAVTLQRQQDAAIAELQDAQDFVADLDATPAVKDFLSKHPFAVAQVRGELESLASTEEDAERQQSQVPSRKTNYE